MKFYFINGKHLPMEKAGIKPDDIGLLRGYGFFEFFRTYQGEFFLFDYHMKRFFNSAKLLGVEIPYKKEEIKEIAENLKKKNKLEDCSIRLICTGGSTINSTDYNPQKATFIALCHRQKPLPDTHYQKGVSLLTLEHQRIIPEAKTINYALPISKKHELKDKKAFDFLYTCNGNILESVTANFFLIKDNKLITPKEDILMGTTRAFVINLAKKEFKIEERAVKVEELKEAEEAFLTATNKEVLPVIKVDEKKIGKGAVGEKTKKLMDLFRKKVKDNSN